MTSNCSDKNDGVAGQPGAPAPPPAQATPPDPSSLPSTSQQSCPSFFLPSQQQYHDPSQPDEELNIPELDNDDAIDDSLFGYINYLNASLPPPPPLDATSVAPFVQQAMPPLDPTPVVPLVQAAMPPPPQMQLAMQPSHYSHQPLAMVTMEGGQYYYFGAAPEHAVLPDAPPPASETTKPAGGRRRGRPPGSTTKSKSNSKSKSKVANTAAAAGRRQQAPTASAIIALPQTVGAGGEEEQEVVEYADISPPGIRFKPSDEELIWYLKSKYLGRRMPVDFIKEINVFEDHPSTVQDKCGASINGAWYLFTSRDRKYRNGYRPIRSVGKMGYWKSNGKEKNIIVNGIKIGKVNALTFMLGRQPKGAQTSWKMKEYRIKQYQLDPNPPSMLLDPWVICKLFCTKDPQAKQHDFPVKARGQPDKGDEHVGDANGGGGEDTIDGSLPPDGPGQELGIEYYFTLDDFGHGDPEDQ